jgi:two-component system, cell cycle sensor histidine kinase and response regulator CckA
VQGVNQKEEAMTDEVGRLVHELQVHQVELEAQNDELRRVQQELEAARARYFDLYDLAPVGYLTLSEDGLILETNLTAATLLGAPRGALIKQPLTRSIVPEDQDIYYLHRKKLFETGTPQVCEIKMARSDGAQFWARLEAQTGQDGPGGTPSCRVVLSDISRQKEVEEALRAGEGRYRRITEGLTDYLYTVMVKDGRAVQTTHSPACEAVTGYTAGEFAADPYLWLRMIAAEDRDRVIEHVRGVYEGKDSTTIEHRIIRKDGQIRWVSYMTISQIDPRGRLMSYDGVVKDITERKRAEEERDRLQAQLLQAQKMESVGRLAGGMAHDFNNMLGVIIGNAEMGTLRINVDEPIFHNLQEILKASHRSADTVRQLLAFARKQTISPKVLALNDMVPGMLNMLRQLIGEDVELRWIPGKDVGTVRMDPTQINQMLANLVVNSRDAIPGAGKITIETANIRFDEDYCRKHGGFIPGEYVLLAVCDTGTGMSAEVMEHLFDPFFTTKEVGRGTGLGLATVYGIVKQNDGFINVCSDPGEGTAIQMYFPRLVGEVVPVPETADERKIPEGTETVLVAEDEKSLLNIARDILERRGYTVLVAGTPTEALRLAESHPGEIHLLLTDVVMPEMNGRELFEKLHVVRPGMKSLFMSGYTADVMAHHGVLDEGVQFIVKPFSPKALAEKVREVLTSLEACG